MNRDKEGSVERNALRVIFAGTPDFAAYHLQVLIHSRHKVVSVYTQPDRPAGRGKKISASPVKQLANHYRLPVFQRVSLKDVDAQREFHDQQADVMVVVAYGLILPTAVLQAPRYGCINVHASLLPRWRGAAPIQRAIAAGDQFTGITKKQRSHDWRRSYCESSNQGFYNHINRLDSINANHLQLAVYQLSANMQMICALSATS